MDQRLNVAPYISGPGSDGHGCGAQASFLRVPPDPRHGRSLLNRSAGQLQALWGKMLRMYCHMGAEHTVFEMALQDLTGVTISLSGLLGGAPIYDTAKHVHRLGLEGILPGLAQPRESRPEPFMRAFTWMGLDRAPASEGYGVHWAALLLLGGLMGSNDIHAATSSAVARTLISLLFRLAPRAATLARFFSVPSFNSMAERAELVVVPRDTGGWSQPEHFLRPRVDYSFIRNGELSVAPADADGLLPEDVMHLSAERKLRRLLKCRPEENVPAAAVLHYQVVLNRHYCIIRRRSTDTDEVGTIIVRSSGVTLQYGDDTTEQLAVVDWLARVKELGFVLQPLITRAGAAWSCDRAVGCFVPAGTRESAQTHGAPADAYMGNFDFIRKGYHILFNTGDMRFFSQRDAIKYLLAPGTVVWVVPDSPTWSALRAQFPPRHRNEQAPRARMQSDARVIKARLNVPTEMAVEEGKLYVAIAVRAARGRVVIEEPYQVHLVNPEELIREGEDDYDEVVEYIMV